MSMARRLRGFGWFLGVALASISVACGGGSAPGGAAGTDGGAGTGGAAGMDGSAGPATALEFCNTFRDLAGDHAARCNGGSKADWIASAEAFVSCAEFVQRIDQGRVTYHRELAQACLDAYGPQRACGVNDSFCFAEVLEGKVANGQACRSDFDCAADAVCWPDTEFGYNACVPSKCTKVPTRVGDNCAALGFCFGTSCQIDKCVANGRLGDDCGDGFPNCDGGLTCDLVTGKCLKRLGTGGSCQLDEDCLTTHACFAGTCKPRLAIGAPCVGVDTACTGFAACNPATGVCDAAGHVGQQCAGTVGNFLCIDGLCQRDADGVPTCYARGEVGAACGSGDDCLSEGCDNNGKCAVCGT